MSDKLYATGLSDHAYRIVLDRMSDGVYTVDLNRRILYWNKAAERLSGWSRDEVIGKCCWDNILTHINACGECLCQGACPLAQTLVDGRERQANVYLHHKDGHRVPVEVIVSPVRDSSGKIVAAVEIFRDKSSLEARCEQKNTLRKRNLLDPVTELPGRGYLETRLEVLLGLKRRQNNDLGILVVRVDHLDALHKKLGAEEANRVVRMAARTLENSSVAFDTVGRWDDSTLLAIVPDPPLPGLSQLVDQVRVLANNSYLKNGLQPLKLACSIATATATVDDTAPTLVARAMRNL